MKSARLRSSYLNGCDSRKYDRTYLVPENVARAKHNHDFPRGSRFDRLYSSQMALPIMSRQWLAERGGSPPY
ncbi:MAG: hypothetical protein ACREBU_04295, partial [Nitrososphaera sp.]